MVGLLVQVLLWILFWLIFTKLEGLSTFLLLVLFSGAALIVPLIVVAGINNKYGTGGIQLGYAIAQGLFTVFPFLCIGNWDFLTGLIMLCLVASVFSYLLGTIRLIRTCPPDFPKGSRLAYVVMQGVFGFSIGTIVSIVVAVIIALVTGRRKK